MSCFCSSDMGVRNNQSDTSFDSSNSSLLAKMISVKPFKKNVKVDRSFLAL